MTSAAVTEAVKITDCPDQALQRAWDSVITEPGLKARVVHHPLLAMQVRPRLPFETTAIHGMVALVGPAGTGKTTLARGLPAQLSKVLKGKPVQLIEVTAHGLMSAEHGQSQQLVKELFEDYLPSLVENHALGVVLLDEVETMAVARSESSLSANPVDVHRATDAVLTGMDSLARTHPSLVFVVTSNFVKGLDEAFLSRADETITVPRPGEEARMQILEAVLTGYGEAFPAIGTLARNSQLPALARATDGLDGRQLRKLVARALARSAATAIDPEKLMVDDLLAAAQETPGQPDVQEDARVRAA